jgi:RNA polymerase sigma factor (sigma-70 family)
MMDLSDFELKALLQSCVEGNTDSRIHFQNIFGEFIYNYPMKMFHLPSDRTGDFYIYVFDGDRIFRRVRSFQARNGAQFRTYLNFYVLRDLFLEWQRDQKALETISIETPIGADRGEDSGTLEDFLEDSKDNVEDLRHGADGSALFKALFDQLDLEKKLLLKLLHLAEFDLSPQEVRLLCKKSGRGYREVISDIEETRVLLCKRDEQFAALQTRLESIHGWILQYQKELRRKAERLNSLIEGSPQFTETCRQKEDLERKLEWRYRQREQTLNQARQFRTTTPYKDIARLLNAPIGTVCSLIARTRVDISAAFTKIDNVGQVPAT